MNDEWLVARPAAPILMEPSPADLNRVADFENRIRALLVKRDPSLLKTYADTTRAALDSIERDAPEKGSKTLKAITADARTRPSRQLEAHLDGLEGGG